MGEMFNYIRVAFCSKKTADSIRKQFESAEKADLNKMEKDIKEFEEIIRMRRVDIQYPVRAYNTSGITKVTLK